MIGYQVLKKEMSMVRDEEKEPKKNFDLVLAEMPRIAEAVKAFPESVQQKAFDVLIAELKGQSPASASGKIAGQKQHRRSGGGRRVGPKAEGVKRPARRAGGPTLVRDLDLAPKGQKSLKDFVNEKQPESNHDKNTVSVYYLAEIRKMDGVTVNHVFTCYRDMRWREPGIIRNSLALTANRKRFLDTADLNNIKLTPAGRNHVEQDLPPKKSAK
jgi:hypothetical protein